MDKCLAFCQALVKSDQKFTLNLSIGKDKLFFSNKELASSWKKKKKSPSQLRREENRKKTAKTKPLKKWLVMTQMKKLQKKLKITQQLKKLKFLLQLFVMNVLIKQPLKRG